MSDGKNVFLATPPTFFYILDSDVAWHTVCRAADCFVDARLIAKINAFEAESGEHWIDADPVSARIVKAEAEIHFFAWESEAFDEAQLSVDAGEAATVIAELLLDDFNCEGCSTFDVGAEEFFVDRGTKRVDIVEQ